MNKIFTKIKRQIDSHPKLSEFILLALIFSISLFIRRIGLKHGFPILTHPDERYVIEPVLKMTRLSTLNPGIFFHPDHVLHYINFFYLNLISFIAYGENFYQAFSEHYLTFYFHGRFIISILGSLIPVVAYKIGKEISPKIAFPTAVVFALFPIYTEHSLYITPDIPLTLFTLLVIYFACKYNNSNQLKFLIFSTIFVAINTAEKYPGLLSLIIPLTAIVIQIKKTPDESTKAKLRKTLLYIGIIGITFIIALFVVAPFLFIKYKAVISALIYETRTTHLGSDNLSWLGNMWFYIKTFYKNINIIGILLFGTGLLSIIKSWHKKFIFILYGFFYWITLSALALHWERWALPMFIAPLFIIAIGITYLWERTKQYLSTKLIAALLIGLFIFQQGVHTLYIPVRKKNPDTRYISNVFCESNDITKTNSIYEGYTPLIPSQPKEIEPDYPAEIADKDYIILSSKMHSRYFDEPDRYQNIIQVYTGIRADNELIAQFEPSPPGKGTLGQIENIIYFIKNRFGWTEEIRYSGPTIEIYQIIN